jgi:MFS family permease
MGVLRTTQDTFHHERNSMPSAFLNSVFLRIWLASLVSGTAVADHETAATWTMNLMSPSGLFISLMASLASLPFFFFTLPAGVLADAFNEGRILRLANLWLAGWAGALALLGSAGMLNPVLLLAGVFLLGMGFAINAPAWASLVPQVVTDEELPSASTLKRCAAQHIGYSWSRLGRGPSDESWCASGIRSKLSRLLIGCRDDSYSPKDWIGLEPDVA